MRCSVAFIGLLVACGAPPEASAPAVGSPPPVVQLEPELPRQTIAQTSRLLVEVPLGLAAREGTPGLRVRLTNRSDAPLLADLRSSDRVIGVEGVSGSRPGGARMPLTADQRAELALVSALTSIPAGGAVEYAVPLPALAPDCEGVRRIPLSGVLIVLDGDRVTELAADGVEVEVPCEASPAPLRSGTPWVAERVPMAAPDRPYETFGEELAPLVRAASVDPTAEIALLSFSYDPRPIERFRYDACVALGRCPARSVGQPAGSLHAPAVGMTWEGAEAFCVTRGLHVASAGERQAIADPSRELVTGDPSTIVLAAFSCVHAEAP